MANKKTIWIINDYAGSKYHGMEFRHYYLARQWVKNGHKVYIISASYSHLFKKLPNAKKFFTFEVLDGINYIWLKVPKYKHSRDFKRVFKWLIFSLELFFLPVKKIQRPDVVIASPMATFLVLPAYKWARKFGAKFIFEVKDIWPLTLIELGNISPMHPLIKLMQWFEKYAIKKANYIVSPLPNYGQYLQEFYKNLSKNFIWISNGICLEDYKKNQPLPKQILEKIPKNKFIVGYTGTIGLANALEFLLEAAKMLVNNPHIHFLIVGNGSEKKKIQSIYGSLPNVTFIDAINKNQIPAMLNFFDVCYIGLRRKKIFRYGVSPNKLFDYMYNGKPIVSAIDMGNFDLIKKAKCGISVEPENPKAIKDAILKLFNLNPAERKKLGLNGRKFILENFTYYKLAKKYEKIF